MLKHIVSFSGGKDSMATLLIMLDKGMPIDDIIFADTGLEFPVVYDYLEKVEEYIGRKITRLKHPTERFESLFYKKKIRGGYIGTIYGFPLVQGCHLNSRLKMIPVMRYKKKISNHIMYVGICYDEPERYARLQANERSLLYELKITQEQSRQMVKERGLLNPIYKYFDRQGCWLCPQQGIGGFRKLRKHFPELWDKLMFYGKEAERHAISKRLAQIIPGYTVADLDRRFALEDRQLRLV